MNDIFCECGHSINKHYLDRPSDGDAVGYCTHYDEKKHVFCSCQKSPSDIASEQLARITAKRDAYKRLLKRARGFVGYFAEGIDPHHTETKLAKDIDAALKQSS